MTALQELVRDAAAATNEVAYDMTAQIENEPRLVDLAQSSVLPDIAAANTRASAVTPARRRCAMRRRRAGKSETLERYAADYPQGPHDQPQSMCPAFGSLRVGLRMRRTATILSGSACCVYGLTFTSHFYGARRTVGYVPFNSETLVTGKLFEDIREAVFKLAKPEDYDTIVITNLCVPTASGVPLRLLPKEINGVRIIGIDVPGFRRADPCRSQGRACRRDAEICARGNRAGAGPGATHGPERTANGHAARRNVSGRSGRHRHDAGADGSCRRSGGADARMARTLCRARLRRRRCHPSVLHGVDPRVRDRAPPDHRLRAGRSRTAPRPGSKRSAPPAMSGAS